MFKEVRKCLDDFENAMKDYNNQTKEHVDTIKYFEMHLAEVIMKNTNIDSSKIARFIMAEKGFEIKI